MRSGSFKRFRKRSINGERRAPSCTERTGCSTYCVWPPSRCAGRTRRRATWFAALRPKSRRTRREACAAAAALGLVCVGAAYLLQFRLFADIGPAGGLTAAFLIPVFGVTWGVLLLSEPVSWTLIAGGALVLLDTALSPASSTSGHGAKVPGLRVWYCSAVFV